MTTKPTCVLDLHLLSRKYKTGIEYYALKLSQKLAQKNDFNLKYLGNIPEKSIGTNITAIPLDLPISDPLASNKLLALTLYAEEASLLFSPYYPIPKLRPCKGVFTIHDLIPLKHPEWFPSTSTKDFFEHNIREGVSHADHILADSHSTKKDIVDLLKVDSGKITVAHLAADDRFYKTSKNACPVIVNKNKIKPPYLLSVCTLEPRKNLLNTIKAYTLLRKQVHASKDLKLVLAGAPGWNYEILLETIGKSPYAKDIIVTGYITEEELAQLYANAQAFVYASLYEGFGLPVLEAMASSIPVVTAKNSSLVEVGGDAALYQDPYSAHSIAEGIEAAVFDSRIREDCIVKGNKQAKIFSWEKTADTTLKVFSSVLDN